MSKCKTCHQELPNKFPNGVDWHILGINCDCQQDICPIADNAGEDCNLYEKMNEYKGRTCEVCHKPYTFVIENGNMASKRLSDNKD